MTDRYDEYVREIYVTQKVARKQLDSDEEFPGSGISWKEMKRKAIEKELKKFTDFEAFAAVPREWYDVLREHPGAKKVRSACIFYVKHWELAWKDRMLACRFVTLGHQVWGLLGLGDTDVLEGEILFTAPPNLVEVRLFHHCATLLDLVLSSDDWRGAYLQENVRNDLLFLQLPIEMMMESEKRMKAPVRWVYRALYGLRRAGHDFTAGSNEKIEKLGWRSGRHFDTSPSIYVRKMTGEPVHVPSVEERIKQYPD